jgi:hypothetical protein
MTRPSYKLVKLVFRFFMRFAILRQISYCAFYKLWKLKPRKWLGEST